MCLIAGFRKLARNNSFSEGVPTWLKHNGTHAFSSFSIDTRDLNSSPSVMHQQFLNDHYLSIYQHTYGYRNGIIFVRESQNFKVTANGPVDPDHVLMWLKVIENDYRSKVITMELNHTGEKICYFYKATIK